MEMAKALKMDVKITWSYICQQALKMNVEKYLGLVYCMVNERCTAY